MTARRADPVRQLIRALNHSAAEAGVAVTLDYAGQTPWASVTFIGARHSIVASASDATALANWLAMLPEAELPLHGHFVASCAAELAGATPTIELLVLET